MSFTVLRTTNYAASPVTGTFHQLRHAIEFAENRKKETGEQYHVAETKMVYTTSTLADLAAEGKI